MDDLTFRVDASAAVPPPPPNVTVTGPSDDEADWCILQGHFNVARAAPDEAQRVLRLDSLPR
jgi:hypothetical protein